MQWRKALKIFAFAPPKQLMNNHITETITVDMCQDFHYQYSILGKAKMLQSPPAPPSPKMPPLKIQNLVCPPKSQNPDINFAPP